MAAISLANRVHVKMSTDDVGQKEQDANTALLNLDKGLRSNNIGEQCEAIVTFPVLFEKFPFPILINSAYIRLADTFRDGNNFIRLCILKVVKESRKHLEKILNVSDISKTISTVIHSNDPVARAITIRTLGNLATILSEEAVIHHLIMMALDSHDVIEVKAAIHAANNFTKVSRTFALNICEKLKTIIDEILTPLDIKASIIPILKHMHHDLQVAEKAREICQVLLYSYPSQKYLLVTLHTMTSLSVETIVQAQPQIELLLRYVEDDTRWDILHVILQDLSLISKKMPHLWTFSHKKRMATLLSVVRSTLLVSKVLNILLSLSKFINAEDVEDITSGSNNYQVLNGLCYHSDQLVSSKALLLMTKLAGKINSKEMKARTMDGIMMGVQSFLVCEIKSPTSTLSPLKKCLGVIFRLITEHDAQDSTVLQSLLAALTNLSGGKKRLVAECLANIGHTDGNFLWLIIPDVVEYLSTDTDTDCASKVLLCTTLLQFSVQNTMTDRVQDLIVSISKFLDYWSAWKLTRQALRYGQFAVAYEIILYLRNKVSIEQFYYWLTAILHICEGESTLTNVADKNDLEVALKTVSCYERSISSFRAASMQSANLDFQLEYSRLRCSLLRAHCQLLLACNTFRTCPPPAIVCALANTTDTDVTRSSRFSKEVGKCCSEYQQLKTEVVELYRSSFDADHSSLSNINTMQKVCDFMISSINLILKNQKPIFRCEYVRCGETNWENNMERRLNNICDEFQSTMSDTDLSVLSHKHINALTSAATQLISTSLGFPRFFFQKLQSTIIKLAISPQSTEALSVSRSTELTVKVEGVIDLGPRPGLYRKVHALKIFVDSDLISKTQLKPATKGKEKTSLSLSQTTEPNNDYFISYFLLSFPIVGKYLVQVSVAVIDEDQQEWSIDPRKEFHVKSVDDRQS